ncbi:glycosyltransferase [Ectobacillus antri]|jgi:GT2 family glycosyltransferase|uniref:Glycosyltransferase n=1 Tax=Ectobacillus antri TaxID=2486280 RepID=A0ABT6H9G0_9BACI|nr:glycosyltransferase [Ectobacillus antri]MDG4657621.1 glycosyltransferase [Ectobacillus antri]MDG5755141.1 glycosyltransferase [Ectobacillus antri]
MKTTIVMVLYNQKLQESKTFVTMEQTLLNNKDFTGQYELIVYDNSLKPQEVPATAGITYVHDERNLGIAQAYQYAWEQAKQNGSEWLLLLDHDTELTPEYVDTFFQLEINRDEIAAVVPMVMCEGTMISPVFSHTLQPLRGEKPVAGKQEQPVMAINSGTAVNMAFLSKIGGFTQEFPLDFLDHWFFYKVYEEGYKVLVSPVTLEHELSVMNYDTVSLNRYKSIIGSELKFYKKYKRHVLKRYRLQLMMRAGKQLLFVKNKKIALHTLRTLLKV